jgi:hypothetical protein
LLLDILQKWGKTNLNTWPSDIIQFDVIASAFASPVATSSAARDDRKPYRLSYE